MAETLECPLCEHRFPARTTEPAIRPWKVGDTIDDRYDVKALLGEGGMGQVFHVYHRAWQLDLAVKCPRLEALPTPAQRAAFVMEAETWVGLGEHPHVVTCHYVRELDGVPRLFAELVRGGSLTSHITERKLYGASHADALRAILKVGIEVAWGLDHAHRRGLVHQDVKPHNVMMDEQGTAKITDFGIARVTSEGSAAFGGATKEYCSPEQLQGERVTLRSDVWAWAVTMLEMFCGDRTWTHGIAAPDVLEELIASGAQLPDVPACPETVAHLLTRCFAESPNDRPASMMEIADALGATWSSQFGETPRRSPHALDLLADSLNNRAASLLDLGRKDEALASLKEALAADGRHSRALYNLTLLDHRAGLCGDDHWIRTLERLHADAPRDADLALLGAWAHIERGDAERAREWIARARTIGVDRATMDMTTRAEASIREGVITRRLTSGAERIAGGVNGLAVQTPGWLSWYSPEGAESWRVPCAALHDLRASQDGSALVGAGPKAIYVWDTHTGRLLDEVPCEPVAVAVSRAGQHVALAVRGRFFVLGRGFGSLGLLGQMDVPGVVTGVAISPDGSLAGAVTSEELDTSLFTLHVWTPIKTFTIPASPVTPRADDIDIFYVGTNIAHRANVSNAENGIAFNAAGLAIVSTQLDDNLTSINWASGNVERAIRAGHHSIRGVTTIAMGPTMFATTGPDGKIRIWDARTFRLVRILTSLGGGCAWMGERTLATLGAEGVVTRCEIPEMPLAPVAIVRPRAGAAASRAQASFDDHMARVRDANAHNDVAAEITALRDARNVEGFERAPRALAQRDALVPKTARGAYRGTWLELAIDGWYRSAQLSADGKRILLTARNSVALWNLNPLTRLRQVERARIQAASASADLNVVVVATQRIALDLVRFDQPDHPPYMLRGTPHAQRAVATTADGKWAVSVHDFIDNDGTVWLWSLTDASPPCAIDRHIHARGASNVIVARNGDTIVSLSSDTMRVASASRRFPNTSLNPPWPTFDATDIAVSDDGNLICLASGTRVMVFDRRNNQVLRDLTDASRKIDRVVTSGDGRIALVSGTNGVVELVDLESSRDLTKLVADQEQSWFAHGVTDIALDATATRAAIVTDDACRIYALDWERELMARPA